MILRAEAVLMQLEAEAGMRILPGETLLFFDEIQACPRALMALRYLYEQMPNCTWWRLVHCWNLL